MRIAIVSDYISKGGAAVACNRLSEALAVAGHEIRRFVLERGERPANWASGVTFAPEIIGRRLSALFELASAFGCPNASRVCRIDRKSVV